MARNLVPSLLVVVAVSTAISLYETLREARLQTLSSKGLPRTMPQGYPMQWCVICSAVDALLASPHSYSVNTHHALLPAPRGASGQSGGRACPRIGKVGDKTVFYGCAGASAGGLWGACDLAQPVPRVGPGCEPDQLCALAAARVRATGLAAC